MLMAEDKKEEQASFTYNPQDKADPEPKSEVVVSDGAPKEDVPAEVSEEPLFNWSAPDSFSMTKNASWYIMLLLITLGVSAAIYFLTKDKITTGVILVSGLLIGVYAAKKPKTVNYQLTKHGFTVNGRYHEFGEYRSFSVVIHGDARSVVLTPLKRFMPYMYIYFASDMEQQITSSLADVLPKETSHRDAIDNVLRKIGF